MVLGRPLSERMSVGGLRMGPMGGQMLDPMRAGAGDSDRRFFFLFGGLEIPMFCCNDLFDVNKVIHFKGFLFWSQDLENAWREAGPMQGTLWLFKHFKSVGHPTQQLQQLAMFWRNGNKRHL